MRGKVVTGAKLSLMAFFFIILMIKGGQNKPFKMFVGGLNAELSILSECINSFRT